VLLLRILYKA